MTRLYTHTACVCVKAAKEKQEGGDRHDWETTRRQGVCKRTHANQHNHHTTSYTTLTLIRIQNNYIQGISAENNYVLYTLSRGVSSHAC